MKSISIASGGSIKEYDWLEFTDLDDLKKKLIATGHEVVHLILVSPWDDSWTKVKQDILVNDLTEADIAWLNKEITTLHSDSRYLQCNIRKLSKYLF
jgi:hypothetical protein